MMPKKNAKIDSLGVVRVAIYARVSTRRQEEEETIDVQLERARAYCFARGWTVAEVYRDENVSGITPWVQRPDGQKLLRDLKRQLFDVVLVYKLDRLGRKVVVVLEALELFDQATVGMVSATEPFDTTTDFGRMLSHLLAVFAEWERSTIRQRTMDGRSKNVREGKSPGGPPPYGFRDQDFGPLVNDRPTDRRRVVDEVPLPGRTFSEADIIRRMFDSIDLDEMTEYALTDALNRDRVPPVQLSNYPRHLKSKPSEKKDPSRLVRLPPSCWQRTTVGHILHNPIYKGVYHYGEDTVDCPAIVEPAQWDRVQEKLKRNRRYHRSKKDGRAYLLSGLIRCRCGQLMQASPVQGGKYWYYRCPKRYDPSALGGPDAVPCSAPYLPGQRWEAVIWADIVRFAQHPEQAKAALLKDLQWRRENKDELQRQIDNATSVLKGFGDQRERVTSMYRKGQLTEEQKDKVWAEMDAEQIETLAHRDALQERLDASEAIEAQVAAVGPLLVTLKHSLEAEELTAERKQYLTKKAVQWIHFAPDTEGVWEVVARYQFSPAPAKVFRVRTVDRPSLRSDHDANWVCFDVPYSLAA